MTTGAPDRIDIAPAHDAPAAVAAHAMDRDMDRHDTHPTGLSGIGAELAALASDIGTLVRAEAKLAVEEVSDRAKSYAGGAVKIAIGGVIALVGAVFLLVALVVALAEAIGLLLSLLVVGAVFALAGFFLVKSAQAAMKKLDLVPHRAIARAERDVQTLKDSV